MRFGGVLPEDAPDPAVASRARAATLPVPIRGLVPQASLEELDMLGIEGSGGPGGPASMTVVVAYTLWRVPEDRADPANLADLDPVMRAALEAVPPWPRPAWLVASVERMRYPMLWDAVRTTWHRADASRQGLAEELAHHVEHIVVNRFTSLPPGAVHPTWDGWGRPELRGPSAIEALDVVVDGRIVPGIRIDVDPHVVGVGVEMDDGAIVTVVVPRSDLQHVEVAFATLAPR